MKKIQIAFDLSPLKSGHSVRGIGSYTRNLLEDLRKRNDVIIVDSNPDVIHITNFSLTQPLSISSQIPTIVTIYDVIPLIYPKHYPLGLLGRIKLLKQKQLLKKVAAVITISKTSKKDIEKYLNIPSNKVHSIYIAPSSVFRKLEAGNWKLEITKRYNLPKRFVLYVGDVNYNKNIITLARACKKVNIPLVIVGKQAAQNGVDGRHPELTPFKQFLDEFGSDQNILRLGFVSEEELVKIYNLATVYCQPSLYEGFGLPILEAMACSTPVVSSNTSALKEVAVNSALYFDPSDVNDLCKKIIKIIKDKKFATNLAKKGLNRVKDFSWEKTTQETMEVYKSVISKK